MGGPFSASRNTSHDKRHGSFSSSILPFPLRSLTSPPERSRTKRQCETTTTPDTRNHNDTTTPLPSPSRPNASRRWTFQRFQLRFHCFHSPSHPNASQRWTFLAFQHVCHYHHLPRIQMRAGGGSFDGFNATATASTSLASKREPEVDFFGILTPPPPSEGILSATSTATGRCETHTPPRSNVFFALRGSWSGV